MPQYPPLRLPNGSLFGGSDAGTQFVEDDGQSFQPTAATKARFEPDAFGPAVPSAAAVQDTVRPLKPFMSLAPAPAAAAPPLAAPSLFSRVSGALGGAAKRAGTAAAANPLGVANAALGIAGAIEYATAKAPALPGRPDAYAPAIRPAQGLNASSLEAGRRGIAGAQAQAGRATGADTGTTAVTRLVAQQQAGEQQGMLSLKDNEAFQADQRREDGERNAAYDANYKTQRSYQERVFDLGQRAYEARRQQSAGITQAALTYFTQSQANKQQGQQMALETKNRQAEAQNGLLSGTYRSETDPAKARAIGAQMLKNDPNAGTTLKALRPDLFANGGRVTTTTARSTTRGTGNLKRLPTSVESTHAMGKEFGEQMSRITSEAQRAFQVTLLSASNKRARGIRN